MSDKIKHDFRVTNRVKYILMTGVVVEAGIDYIVVQFHFPQKIKMKLNLKQMKQVKKL